MGTSKMNPIELRATVAAQILSGLAIQDGVMSAENGDRLFNDDELTTRAITLTDLLLSKLNQSAPVKPESGKQGGRCPTWQRLDVAQPEVNEACRVVTWDHFSLQIGSVNRLYWDGRMWQDSDGNRALGGITATHVYWFPSHMLPNSENEIRADFLYYIVNEAEV